MSLSRFPKLVSEYFTLPGLRRQGMHWRRSAVIAHKFRYATCSMCRTWFSFFLRILVFHPARHLLSYLHHWNIICLVISSVQTENKSGLFVGCPPSNGYSFPSLFGWGGWENPFPSLNICALTELSQIKNGISGFPLSKDWGVLSWEGDKTSEWFAESGS